MHLMIAVPTYNGTIEVECMGSLYPLQSHLALTRPDLPTSLSYTVGAPVDMARNMLTTIFMNNKEATHLLIVDSDMGLQPQLIQRLLNEDKPVTAAFCPYKVLELEALVRDGTAGVSDR